MTVVYIWFPGDPKRTDWFHRISGHAALRAGRTYCSFWPDMKNMGKEKVAKGLFSSAPANFSRISHELDLKGMGYKNDESVDIEGLDEASVIAAWKKLKKSGISYRLLETNCCTVTNYLLNVSFQATALGVEIMATDTPVRPDTKYLHLILNASSSPTLNPGMGLPTVTPSVTMSFALLVKNALSGFPWSESEIFRFVKQRRREAGVWGA